MGELSVEAVLSRYRAAQSRRKPWESLWQDCYTYALPQRGSGFGSQFDPARRHAERLFDGTATDAVEQLSASLLSQLTPPWSQWFGLVPGYDIGALERTVISEELDVSATTRWLAERLGVPGQLVRDLSPVANLINDLLPATNDED